MRASERAGVLARRGVAGLLFVAAALAPPARGESAGFERSESREACASYDPLRRPFFGDLHVHSSYSFDSYTSGQRNDPWAAYRYARGEAIEVPAAAAGEVQTTRLRRPLDFVSVTDHAELYGEIDLCTDDEWSLADLTPLCLFTRSESFYPALIAASWWSEQISQDTPHKQRAWQCALPGSECAARSRDVWERTQQAAEDHYDRSEACRLTTFVGYEYTDTPGFYNMHRNVIFRNAQVPADPISSFDTGAKNFPELWRRLRSECIEAGTGCDVLAIPHNSNLSGGLMFPDPVDEAQARDRRFFEPVVELIQHKAASECRFDRLAGRGVGTADELCTFEQNKTDNLNSLGMMFGEMQTELGQPVPIEAFARRNMVRNVLKDGLVLEQRGAYAVGNPFRMGFIGSTDTHSATPGATIEDDWVGHLGRRDAGYRGVEDHVEDNPGGLAVVWAEENSRDAIFEAIRRRETYATSGTRPVVRVFAGFGLEQEMCDAPDRVARGYAQGVPMGGELRAAGPGEAPRVFVSALRDPGTPGHPGRTLQRIQVVKGWVDAQGQPHERIIDVAGDATNGAGVDPRTCAPTGGVSDELCSVWQDPDFDPETGAFYYARVLEDPTCRWSTWQCMAAGVNPFAGDCSEQAARRTAELHEREGARGDVFGHCCWSEADQPFHERVIQERAWTSPIWYRPARD